MKRFYINLAVLLGALSLGAPFAHASFVTAQQSDISSSTPLLNTAGFSAGEMSWNIRFPSGIAASTTGAYMTLKGTKSPGFGDVGRVDIYGYFNSSYSGSSTQCTYTSNNIAVSGFTQFTTLNTDISFGGRDGCVMYPDMFYSVNLGITSQYTSGSVIGVSGSESPSFFPAGATAYDAGGTGFLPFIPQFALVTGNFQITPTTNDTGWFLSGAQAFCNSQFGTSTGGINGIGTDIANGLCQVVGYMFVPTSASVSQFSDLEPLLAQKLPFGYVLGVQSTWDSLTASSSNNVPQYSINLGALGIGSTTALGNILPNQMDLLSSSTINKYLPTGVHDTLYSLAEIAIALVAVAGMYEEGKRLIKT